MIEQVVDTWNRERSLNKLLDKAIVAHGGLASWGVHNVAKATALLGGDVCATFDDLTPRQITVFPHLQRAVIDPLGCVDCRSDLERNRLSILGSDGSLVTGVEDVRSAQLKYDFKLPIDPLVGVLLACSTVRSFLTAPFHLMLDGVEVSELVPWNEDGSQWRVLRAELPPDLATAARIHDYFFDADFLLRRHDYHVDGDAGITITELLSHYEDCHGVNMPTKLRGYPRRADLTPDLSRLMISIDISGLEFSVD